MLFVVRCLLFVACLLVVVSIGVRCLLCVVRCLTFAVCHVLSIVRCVMFVAGGLKFAMSCNVCDDCCVSLCVVMCLLFVVSC